MQNKHSRRIFLKSSGVMLGALSGSTCFTSIGAAAENLQFRLISNRDLGCDFIGVNLHKWEGALTSFRLNRQSSTEANNAISKRLEEQYGILTVRRTGPALGDCVRVTPSIYNYPEQMFKLSRALKSMAKS